MPTQLQFESWRLIPIATGYEASSQGQIRNAKTGRILKPWLAGSGYAYVRLGGSGPVTTVHRLVCLAFHGPPPEGKPEAAHFDGDRFNNRSDNLRWASRAENIADQRRHGTLHPPLVRGEQHGRAKLTAAAVRSIRDQARIDGESARALAQRFAVSPRTIHHVLKGSTWAHLT